MNKIYCNYYLDYIEVLSAESNCRKLSPVISMVWYHITYFHLKVRTYHMKSYISTNETLFEMR